MLQEMASRGLSAVYQLGDEQGRSELLGSLMGTLQGAERPPLQLLGSAVQSSGEI